MADSPASAATRWERLELPSSSDLAHQSVHTKQLAALSDAWLSQRESLMAQDGAALGVFLGRVVRSWAIESGIIERLFDLDEGATKTLVEMGLREELVERGSSSLPPAELIAILRDHELAAAMVQELVNDRRPLTGFFIRDLHALLTRRQVSVQAQTPSGDLISVDLAHGEYKKLPNNPTRPDRSLREYCPPEHVESEIESLLAGYSALNDSPVALQAAWLHHRFTQIHPFQDGNGRVARALANVVLLHAGLFPMVVSRHDRPRYIASLERADDGDLRELIDLFAEIEAGTLLKALAAAQVEEQSARENTVDALIERLAERHTRRIRDLESVLRGVDSLAVHLRAAGAAYVDRRGHEIVSSLEERADLRIALLPIQTGGPDVGNEDWWRFQLVAIANDLEYWINFHEHQYWFRLTVRNARNLPVQMQFVTSIHHVGHDLTGIVRVVAFSEFEPTAQMLDDPVARERMRQNCTPRDFVVTYQQAIEDVEQEFLGWLEEAIAMALRAWLDLW